MVIFGSLPTWAVGLFALGAGAILLLLNYGWLLAAKTMLTRRRRGGSTLNAPNVDRDEPTRRPAQ
jgi:hypothetical protein